MAIQRAVPLDGHAPSGLAMTDRDFGHWYETSRPDRARRNGPGRPIASQYTRSFGGIGATSLDSGCMWTGR